jgi:hypothetical protein
MNNPAPPAAIKPKCPFIGCRKKLKLVDWSCKCGVIYCSSHREFNAHACQWVPKKDPMMKCEMNKMRVIASKIDVI